VLASTACIAATPIGVEAIVVAPFTENAAAVDDYAHVVAARSACISRAGLLGLDALPRSTLFAPLDISAHLLAYTRHSVIATGHHRAREGMKTVITGLIATPDAARAIVTQSRARYLVLCSGENEVKKYAKLYPASLTAVLLKDRPPVWLARVPMRPGETIRVWRIRR